MKMMRSVSRKVSVVTCLVFVFMSVMAMPTFASSTKRSMVNGTTEGTEKFYVTINTKAKKSDYIYLKHTEKGMYHYVEKRFEMWRQHLKNSYGRYRITIYNRFGNKITAYDWNCSKKKKLKLSDFGFRKVSFPKTYTYTVTITPRNAFADTNTKAFLHWSGSRCEEGKEPIQYHYFNSCPTPNQYGIWYKSCKGGIKYVGY